jgi:non-ribosomal peptide synthetase component F/acyl carrier protein
MIDTIAQCASIMAESAIEDETEDLFIFPASFAQQRLWFLHQLDRESAAYNIAATLHLTGDLNLAALQQSLNEIIRRHESLRTVFMEMDEQVAQVIHQSARLPISVIDLSGLTEIERQPQLHQLRLAEARRPFDLREAPLLRMTLVREREQQHELVMTMHHVISDGWSVGVLIRELSALYGGYAAGARVELPELSLQYADYSEWQREWLSGEVLEEQVGYWRKQLGGALPVLQLPTDHVRPAVASYRGGLQRLELSAELSDRLEELSRRRGATMFMVLLAGFTALLQRYSGQEEMVIGTVIANRNRMETEGMIGFFVNPLALRVKCEGEVRYGELLERVKEVTLGAYGHQDIPFEKVVQELGVGRELSRNPLFEVLFVLQNGPQEAVRMAGLEVVLEEVDTETAKFDLNVMLTKEAGKVGGYLQYNADLFEAETISRLAGHFQTLLSSIVADEEERIGELELLTAGEREQLLPAAKAATAIGNSYQTPSVLFEKRVAQDPEQPAIVCGENEITYRELEQLANRLGASLVKHQVGPETVVGLMTEGETAIAATLAVLKSGGAFLLLDPAASSDSLAQTIESGWCSLILIDHKSAPLIESVLVKIPANKRPATLSIEDDANQRWPAEVVRHPEQNALAFLECSYDDEGAPRARMVEQSALTDYLTAAISALQLTASDRLACLSPHRSTQDMILSLAALISGATICLEGDDSDEGLTSFAHLDRERITVAEIDESHFPVAYVLDSRQQLTPTGIGGELCVGGVGIPRGYFDDPAGTAEDFLPDPYGEPGARLFRTGKQARHLADGRIMVTGRIDRIVNLRGMRIDLDEIEKALVQHPSVRRAAVDLRIDQFGEQRLVAYMEAETGDVIPQDALFLSLANKLPSYMLPFAMVEVPWLPLEPDGHVNYHQLPTSFAAPAAPDNSTVTPRNEIEEAVAGIWREVLDRSDFSIHDKFFDLGGDSLKIIRVFLLLEDLYPATVTVADLFTYNTIASIGGYLKEHAGQAEPIMQGFEL